MNVASTAAARASSRFVEHVRTLSGAGGHGRVGFRAQPEAPKRHVGLIAALGRVDAPLMQRLAETGADALEVPIADLADLRAAGEAARGLAAPVGVVVRAPVDDAFAIAAAEAGIDWVRLDLDASVAALGWERPARFLSVPLDIDLRITGALNAPFTEAVVVTAPGGGAWSFQVAEGLRLRTLAEVLKKPVLAALPADAPPLSAAVCMALGLDAVLVAAQGGSAAERVADYLTHLQAAPPER